MRLAAAGGDLFLGPIRGSRRAGQDELAVFLGSAARFWSSPAREMSDVRGLSLTLSGFWEGVAVDEQCECLIQSGEFARVLLFPVPGGLERLTEAALTGKSLDVERYEVRFDAEPAWALEPLRRTYGLERIPIPGNVGEGNWLPAKPRVVAPLAALLDALANYDPASPKPSEGRVTVGGDELMLRLHL